MGQYLKWQEECADLMRDMSVLETEYLYKMRKLTKEYQPKIQDLKQQIRSIYIANGLIEAEKGVEENGEELQKLQ